MQPRVDLTILNGALGIIPPDAGDVFAVAGPASDGPLNTPVAFARGQDAVAAFKSGPMVQLGALLIQLVGKPVVFCRTAASNPSSYTALDVDFGDDSTSTPSVDGSFEPDDDYEPYVIFTKGGTRGIDGIKYRTSLDGGRTLSAEVALGTGTSITIPTAAGLVKYGLSAGDITAGDNFGHRCTTAYWNTTDLGTALDALKKTQLKWAATCAVGPADDDAVQAFDAWFEDLKNGHKFRWGLMSVRIPNVAESEGAYNTALAAEFGDVATDWVDVAAGSAKIISAIDSRSYRRPAMWANAVRQCAIDPGLDPAQVSLGPLKSVSIADANGNPDDHDESLFPGLDDLRFTTLRSFSGRPGVYINNSRMFCGTDSDFVFVQLRRVMNIGCTEYVAYLEERLSSPVEVSKKTGFITEGAAKQIENGASQRMGAQLFPQKRASGVSVVLSRTDNILSTFTITSEARIVPNGYVKVFRASISFNNPALKTALAA